MAAMTTASFLAPTEIVNLLEEAQCSPPASVTATLRNVVLRLRRPHDTVTEAALTLLELFPHETIPSVPDLISDNPKDITNVLQSFSNLLQTDRTLLVPIIGILPDLPLSTAHHLHARATLSFALTVVDEPDLPAVVRALLLSASTPPSARWAARAVRTGLSRTSLNPTITPLLAHVLADSLRASTRVARTLRVQAGSPFLWSDLLVWILSLSPRLTSPLPMREAYVSIQHALRSALLSNPARCRAHVRQAAPALADLPHAVHRFALAIVTLCPSRLSDLIGCVHLIRALITACPNATGPIASHLASDTRPTSQIVLRALIQTGISVPHARGALAENVSFVCEGDKCAQPQSSSTLWSHLLVKVRKGLLFGQEPQRRAALQLASTIVRRARKSVVNDVLSVMNECIPYSLADGAAIDMLSVTNEAAMRGYVDPSFIDKLYSVRVASKCPPSCFVQEHSDDNEATGVDPISVKIDVGMIWDQPPSAVATIVSTAVSCLATQRCSGNVEKLSSLVLNVMVLVPVLCISLYEAVDQLNQDGIASFWKEGESIDAAHFPNEVVAMDNHDLAKAVSAFGVGIASIIGVLNTTCCSLARTKRIIDRRSIPDNDEHEADDHKATWALLERLMELHRMMNALFLGHEVLTSKFTPDQKPRKRRSGRPRKRELGPKKKYEGYEALVKTEAILANVRNSLFGQTCNQTPGRISGISHRFPPLCLESVISSLVTVPDESEMYGRIVTSSRDRDPELVQIDLLLLRLLLRYMRESTILEAKHSRHVSKDVQVEESESDHKLFPAVNPPPCELSKMSPREAEKFLQEVNKHHIESDEFFLAEEEKLEVDEPNIPAKSDMCEVRWAVGTVTSSTGDMDYIDDAISALGDQDSKMIHATEVLHSPNFAALLLDRAASYVSISRNARAESFPAGIMGDLIEVSGMALSCLVLVFRELPSLCESFPTKGVDDRDTEATSTWDVIRKYVEDIGKNLLTRMPNDLSSDGKIVSENSDDTQRFSRVVDLLGWIQGNTPDSIVAAKSAEALMTLAELDVLTMKFSRTAAFMSLTTIYEYDRGALWEQNDKMLVLHDSFQEWLVRRRGQVHFADALKLEDSSDFADSPPWVRLKERGGKINVLEHNRLGMFFCGMNVGHAVLEGCGWVREISLAISVGGEEVLSRPRKGSNRKKISKKRTRTPNQPDDEDEETRKRLSTCDVLIDMIGFRTIMSSLIQLVQMGLESYVVDGAMPVEMAHEKESSPLPAIGLCVRLFSGIQELYHHNHQALMSSSSKPNDEGTSMDENFQSDLVSAYIVALQHLCRRMEEVMSWYTNESTNVGELHQDGVTQIHEIIGGALSIVSHCAQLAATIRQSQSQQGGIKGATGKGETRKTPGYSQRKQARGNGTKNTKRNELSKGRKLLPRLASACEQIRKIGERLGRSMGIVKGALAAKSIVDDNSLHFGVGVNLSNMELDGTDDRGDENCDSRSESMEEMDVVEGFHARGGAAMGNTKTITVRFGDDK